MQRPRCVTTVIVADASVLVVALADDGPDGDQARARLREAMHATLLTADRRLARAAGPQCPIEILQPATRMPAPEPPDNPRSLRC